jgi:hypothetical protein
MNKAVTVSVGLMFLVTLFGMMALRQHYTRHMPESIQMEIGRTGPIHVNYGKIVYVTPHEKRTLVLTYSAFAVACGITISFLAIRSLKRKRNDDA